MPGLPPVVPSTETRPLSAGVADSLGLPAGLPVCVGAADSVLAAEALGRRHAGVGRLRVGHEHGHPRRRRATRDDPDRRCLVTPLAVGGWGTEMDLVSTGAAVAWLARLLGFGESGQARVFESPRPPTTPCCRRRSPSSAWASRAPSGTPTCAAPSSASISRTAPPTWRAPCSTASCSRASRCLARLTTLGLPHGEVRVAWRRADPWFCRRLADASGRTVVIGDPAVTSSAAGAARLAAVAAGSVLPTNGRRRGAIDPRPRRRRCCGERRWHNTRSCCCRSGGCIGRGLGRQRLTRQSGRQRQLAAAAAARIATAWRRPASSGRPARCR